MKRFMLSVGVIAVLSVAAHAADKRGGSVANGKSGGVAPVGKPVGGIGNGNSNINGNSQNINNNAARILPNNLNGFQGGNANQNVKPQVLKPQVTSQNYHVTNGVKKNFGFCFNGFDHGHWTHQCWFAQYGCNCFWCPCTTVWYYWCAPDGCWYPVTYCPYGKFVF